VKGVLVEFHGGFLGEYWDIVVKALNKVKQLHYSLRPRREVYI
jgi:hypothetical protein